MEPSFHHFQFVFLNKYEKTYEKGRVVAFSCEGLDEILVKRVAACPGDRAVISEGTLFVNGVVSEVFPQKGFFSEEGLLKEEILLGKGQYLVLGDNAEESVDSRFSEVGVVQEEDILGFVCGT